MKNKLLWLFSFIPLFITLVVLKYMPDTVPMHYGLGGQIDRWGSKYENLLFPIFIILFAFFWIAFISYFRKKASTSTDEKEVQEALSNIKVLNITSIVMAIFFGLMQCFILYTGFRSAEINDTSQTITLTMFVNVLMGIVLIILGNILPKTKRNSAIGLRTTWSMKSDEAWAKSNRWGGILFVITGIIIIIVSLLTSGLVSTIVLVALLILDAIISCIISYRVS